MPRKQRENSEEAAAASPDVKVQVVPLSDLHQDPANARRRTDRGRKTIRASLARFGAGRSIVLDGNNVIRAGNGTVEGAEAEGISEVLVVEPKPGQLVAVKRSDWTETEATAYSLVDNRAAEQAEWNDDILAGSLNALRTDEFDLDAVGFTDEEIDDLIGGGGDEPSDEPAAASSDTAQGCPASKSLSERFGVPPFSVLDARQGYWQDRKRAWLSLGIQSELGRGGGFDGSLRPEGTPDELRESSEGDVQRPRMDQGQGADGTGSGRPRNASPGGSARPACDYSKRQRGDGRGKPLNAQA